MFSSVQSSRSVMSNYLLTHGLQHTRPPCPSSTPRVYSNSCPLSQWCHPTISSLSFPSLPTFNLSHSIVFLYFFSLITEESFLISPCSSLELCIQMGISFLSPLLFASLLFTAICKASSDSHFAFLYFFFLGMVWFLSPVQCHKPPSIGHQALCLSDLSAYIWNLERW